MKILLVAVLAITFSNTFAGEFKPTDFCKNTVTQFYKKTAATSEDKWEFISLKGLKVSEAKKLIDNALPGDEDSRATMLSLLSNKNTLFYILNWDAPGNTGSDVVAVEKSSCKVVKEILYRSEE